MPISRAVLEPTPDEQVDEADDEVEEQVEVALGDVDCCTLSVVVLLAPPLMPPSNTFAAVMATPAFVVV